MDVNELRLARGRFEVGVNAELCDFIDAMALDKASSHCDEMFSS